MELVGKRILIISPEPWGVNFVSKHHYAEVLIERGNTVFFCHPDNPAKAETQVKLLRDRTIRGLRKLPSSMARKLMQREVKRILKECGPLDLVWSFDNSRLYYLDLFKAQKSIAHVVDFDMNYQSEAHAKSADLCLGSTHVIADRHSTFNPNSHQLGHGYRKPKDSTAPIRSLVGKQKALYVGNLLIPSLNRKLVIEVIEALPEVDFHFVGSLEPDNLNANVRESAVQFLDRIKQFPNTHLHGVQPANELASYIQAADWCFMAYDHIEFRQQISNPHKVMEFLAYGKPVFATPMMSWEDNDLLHKYESAEDLQALLNQVDLSDENLMNKRQTFALKNTYEDRILQIEKLLSLD